jgi:hypothetical protein
LILGVDLLTLKAYASRVNILDFLRENPLRGVRQIDATNRRGNALRTLIQGSDLDGLASRRVPGLNVPPPIANHETSLKVDIKSLPGLKEQTGFRLAAFAVVRVVVGTDKNRIDSKLSLDDRVHGVHYCDVLSPSGDVGLVGHHDEEVTRALQLIRCVSDSWQKFEIVQ